MFSVSELCPEVAAIGRRGVAEEHRCAAVLLSHVAVCPAQVCCPFSHPALHVVPGAPWARDVEHLQVALGDDCILTEGARQSLPRRLAEAVLR